MWVIHNFFLVFVNLLENKLGKADYHAGKRDAMLRILIQRSFTFASEDLRSIFFIY